MIDLNNLLESCESVAITGHIHPDGDCIGSCLGMYNYLKKLFPQISIDVFLEKASDVFDILPGVEDIKLPTSIDGGKVYDAFIVLDCGDEKRIGMLIDSFRKAKLTICIDHHESNNDFADVNLVLPNASATCEIVGQIVLGDLDKDIAACLYTGIVHDTGVYQYSSTSSLTMELAGKFIDTGIDYPYIVEHTFYEKTYNQNRILAAAILKAKLYDKNRIIASILTAQDMNEYGVKPIDLEGIVAQLRVTRGTDVAIFMYEKEDGTFKVSTRASGDINLATIAVEFGGGGHQKAAGFNVEGDPQMALEKIIKRVQRARENV